MREQVIAAATAIVLGGHAGLGGLGIATSRCGGRATLANSIR